MKALLKEKTGSISILPIGFIFLLLSLTFLTVEMGGAFENYDYCMDVLKMTRTLDEVIQLMKQLVERWR